MQMQHNFTVGVPVDVAWSALLDPERVAPCMPGATLTKAEGNEFAGSVKVKLGPISLLYKGTGTFTEVDETARRVVIDASGKDARGAGTAAATVTAVLTDEGAVTSVRVDTDLKVTGKPAQLGRGLISEVGGRILDQFAACLAERLVGEASGSADGATGSTAGIAGGASTGGTSGTPSGEGSEPAGRNAETGTSSGNGDQAAAAARHPSRATGGRPAWRVTQPSGTDIGRTEIVTADTVDETAASASTVREEPSDQADSVVTGREVPQEESIDLLGAAGLPVMKRVAPVAAGAVAILLLRRLLRRRRARRR